MRIWVFLTLFAFNSLYSQTTNWWVFFSDKDCANSISLSDRAVDKRFKQNINFDTYDFSVCQHYVDSLIVHDVIIRNKSRWLNAVSITVNSTHVLDHIQNYSFVKKIQPVAKLVNQSKSKFENKIIKGDRCRLSNSFPYGTSFNQIDMLGGVELHNQGFLGNGMLIAVFDAGFTGVESLPIFDNLWANNRILDMYDFVDNDYDVFGGSTHGTMVLSTMGGYMPDSLIGTAPEASYMLFRTEDSNSETLIEEDNWAVAAEYADSVGVDIINSSLGYTILYDDTLNSHSYTDMDGNSTIITNAADFAASKGILVVNSAGNSGNNNWYYIGAPADGDSVLAVGAVNFDQTITSFSSRGPSYDGRIKPNVCAQGAYTIVADLDSTIKFGFGTSFSSPIIAGLSACLWETNTTLNNMDVLRMIEESSHLFNNPNDSLGYGIPNFYQAYLNNNTSLNQTFDNLKIYPNPFDKEFVVVNETNEDLQLDVFNVMGDFIFSTLIPANFPSRIINELSHKPSGFYFISTNHSSKLYPLIKLHGK